MVFFTQRYLFIAFQKFIALLVINICIETNTHLQFERVNSIYQKSIEKVKMPTSVVVSQHTTYHFMPFIIKIVNTVLEMHL